MSATESISFEGHIKPLFTERDHGAMTFFVDLWSYDDVAEKSAAILSRLRDGSMPCYGPWNEEQIDLFQKWVDGGKAA
jgi:hypothetical protein